MGSALLGRRRSPASPASADQPDFGAGRKLLSAGGANGDFCLRHLAEITQAEVTLVHIFSRSRSDQTAHWAESEITGLIAQAKFETPVQALIVQAEDVGKAILHEAQTFDLVVLHSQRYPLAAEGFGFSRITSQVVQQMQQSAIVLGESHLA